MSLLSSGLRMNINNIGPNMGTSSHSMNSTVLKRELKRAMSGFNFVGPKDLDNILDPEACKVSECVNSPVVAR